MARKPSLKKRVVAEALESRLLFSATADFAVLDDGHSDVDYLSKAASETDLTQVLDLKWETQSTRIDSPITSLEPLLTQSSAGELQQSESQENDSALIAEDSVTDYQGKSVIFVDTSVGDYETLIEDIQADQAETVFDIILIDSDKDGIEQISASLAQLTAVGAVHIISHGNDGKLQIGNTQLSNDSIEEHGDKISSWKDSLTSDADILIYGCNLASNDDGLSLVKEISRLTDADVAASNDATGSEELGGDWELENIIGNIETDSIYSSNWQFVLGSITANDDSINVWFGETITGNLINGTGGSGIQADTYDTPPANIVSVTYDGTLYNSFDGSNNITINADQGTFVINQDGTYTYSPTGIFAEAGIDLDTKWDDAYVLYGYDVGTAYIDGGSQLDLSAANETPYQSSTGLGNQSEAPDHISNTSNNANPEAIVIDLQSDYRQFEIVTSYHSSSESASWAAYDSSLNFVDSGSFTGIGGGGASDRALNTASASGDFQYLVFTPTTSSDAYRISELSVFELTPTAEAFNYVVEDNDNVTDTGLFSISFSDDNNDGDLTWWGTEDEGQTLTSNLNDVDGYSSVSYQWQRSADGETAWADISGATASTYVLVGADANNYVRATATYTDDEGTVEDIYSFSSAQITSSNNAGSISFTGTETEDQALNSNISDSDGASGSVSYQWERSADGTTGWASISGATSANYTLTDADSNQYVRVTASYTDDLGYSEDVTSSASGQITAVNDTASINFSGTETEDQTLSASISDDDGFSGETYQWQRSADGATGWANISGATSANYVLTDADYNQYVRVTANYTDGQGTTETPSSSASGQISGVNDTASISFSGTETEDQTLSASISDDDGFSGETYQWQRSADGATGWANISGATSANYVLTDADYNQYVRVTASYTDDQGTAETPSSSASGQISGINDTASIAFTGTETEDQTLSATITDDDGFSGETYQWQRSADGSTGWANISGATSANYTLTDADYNQYVRVSTSYTDDQGTAETPISSTSGQISGINDTASIAFTGTETEDQTLSATITDDDGVSGESYQWQRSADGATGWANISSATSANYVLTDADYNQYVRVTTSYTDDQGTAETPISSASGQISGINDTASIAFTGTETEDQTLSATITDDDGVSGESYQWQRSADGATGWANISSATSANYVLTDADYNQYVRVTTSYTDDQGTAETPISSASGQISGINDTASIAFTGTETEDQTLSATITDDDGFSGETYQWQRSADGATAWANISGATSANYVLTNADYNQYLRVTANYTDGQGTTETPSSSASGQISGVNDTASISFSGTETEDQTLSASISDDDGFSGETYQWQRSADGATGWANISGATSANYVLTDADYNQYVRVTASYTDDQGTAETPSSSASGQISGINDTASIAFTGTETEDQTLSATITDDDGFSGETYQWQRSADGSSGWANISGATSANYILTDADYNQYVRVTASYTDDQGTAETPQSSASGQISGVNDSASIAFTGTETEDQTLSATITDDDGVSGETYQWQRSADGSSGWANISGATSANYTLTDADYNQYVRVIASYTDDQGAAETPQSSASGQISGINDTASIAFTGTETEDQTLSATIADDDGVSGETYQWQRSADGSSGWANISGATSANYTLTDADYNQYVRVTASYTDDQGTAETPQSSVSGQISGINDTASIAFTGTETEDQTLSATIADDDGVSGETYQWQRSADGSSGWANISGATSANYTLTDADYNQYVRITANYTDDQGTAETPSSSASGQISGINDTASIAFTGTETEDQTLSATITDDDGFSGETYQWQRSADGATGWANISGATSANYVLTDADYNQYLRITANYTDDQGTAETPISSTSGQIAGVNDAASISFSGTETEDQTLSASISDDDGFSGETYQWQRSADGATGWANISGATNASYTLTNSDANQYVRVSAIYTDDQGTAESPISIASGSIIPVNTDPTLSNSIQDQNTDEDSVFVFAFPANSFTDGDGDILNYSARLSSGAALPGWLNFDSLSRTLNGTPDFIDVGNLSIEIVASDGNGGTDASDTFDIIVNTVNDQPTTSGITGFSVNEDSPLSVVDIFTAFADEEDGASGLGFQLIDNTNSALISNINIDSTSANLELSYAANQFGSSTITLRATDTQGLSVDASFTVTVTPVNDTPTADTVADINFRQGTINDSIITLGSIFSDIEDGPGLIFSVESNSNPEITQALSIDSAASELTLTYNPQVSGQTTLVLRATDSQGAWVETPINISISPIIETPQSPEVETPETPEENPSQPSSNNTEENQESGENTSETESENESQTSNQEDQAGEGATSTSELGGLARNLGSNLIISNVDREDEYQNTQENKQNISEKRNSSQEKFQTDSTLATLASIDNIYISDQEISEFNDELKKLRTDIQEKIEEEKTQKAIFAGLSVSVTTGLIVWALRAGSLFLTLFSILPLWKGFDPLPVLNRELRKKELKKREIDRIKEDKQRGEVGYMFDNNQNANSDN